MALWESVGFWIASGGGLSRSVIRYSLLATRRSCHPHKILKTQSYLHAVPWKGGFETNKKRILVIIIAKINPARNPAT